MSLNSFEAFIDNETHHFQSLAPPKSLWKVLFSKDFFPSFLIIVILRALTVLLGFLPQRLMDTYLRNLTLLKNQPIELWVLTSGLSIIILLYFQGINLKILYKISYYIVYMGNWVEKQKQSFFLRLKLRLNMLLIHKSLMIKTLSREGPNFLNLITQDVSRIESGVRSFIDTFGILLELILGVFYLYNQISGFHVGLPVLVLALIIGNILLVALSQISALRGQKARDQRISLIQELLQGIRAVKLLGAEGVFQRKVLEARGKEFIAIRTVRVLDAVFNSFIRSVGLGIMLVLSLWSENLGGKADLFSALVLVNQLVYPITAFPWSIGSAFGVIFPYYRLSNFLSEKEVGSLEKEALEEGVIVKVKDLAFKWNEINRGEAIKEENEVELLKTMNNGLNISDFTMKKGDFVIIYGENGTGKTTFIRLLLKELIPNSGFLSLKSSEIAYVSQDTWLLQGSFETNILFGSPFNKEKYETCLTACCLTEEVLSKEKGFLIGVNGNRLSGGQRQRLALCRALYQDRGLYFLDDILSSLDEKVSDDIFRDYVIKNLVNKGKTVLFVTSQEKFLPFAHKAYELKDGLLSLIKNRETKELNLKRSLSTLKEASIIETKEIPLEKPILLSYLQPFDPKGFYRYLKAIGLKTLLLIIAISLSQQGLRHYAELFLNNTLTSTKTPLLQSFLFPLALIYLILTLARGLTYCYGVLKAAKALFKELLEALLEANMEFFERYPPGELMRVLIRDLDSMDCNLPEDVNGWVSTMINILGIFGVVIYEFPVLLVVCWVVGRKAFKHYKEYSMSNKELKQEIKAKEAGLLNDLMELSQ